MNMKKIEKRKAESGNVRAFTLIELLVVISIIGVLAGFTIPALGMIKKQQYLKTARAEMEFLQTALENYKAKYGAYPPGNQLSATANYAPAQFSQLYYELAGTINNGNNYVTLDGSATIAITDVKTAYGVGGFINCTKGTGEDDLKAKNFLSGIRQKDVYSPVSNNLVATTVLVTSVGGPDDNYKPLSASGLNPIRYVYPGVNNPNSYDLWVQLVISGKTNLVCNWSRQTLINSPLP
jgi:prepilin-type N-terminal cleavage/methylation domain-containing protein